jgi:hypothetical protein
MQPRPYRSLTVNFADVDYDCACERFGAENPGIDPVPLSSWQNLGDLLAYRPGWSFDVVNLCAGNRRGEAMWSFGLLGSSLLQITVDRHGRYLCYDHDNDDASAACPTIPEVEAWLATRDGEVAALNETQIAIARENDWQILKTFPFQVHVGWSDGAYHASLPGNWEPSFDATLSEAVSGVAELICRLHGAPVSLAPKLKITAELDATATDQLRRQA